MKKNLSCLKTLKLLIYEHETLNLNNTSNCAVFKQVLQNNINRIITQRNQLQKKQ